MTVLIIDTHALIVSDDFKRYPLSPLGGQRSTWSSERSLTAGQMVAAMDEAGISKAVLLQSATTYGFDNSYLADSVAAYHDRFCGAFSINVLEEQAVEQMKYWIERGLTGMRIFARGSTLKDAWLAVDDRRTWPAWACACDLGLPVSTNTSNLSQVRAVLERYPQLKVILEHVTRPQIAEGPPYSGLRDLLDLAPYGIPPV